MICKRRPLDPHTSCILGYGFHPFTTSQFLSQINDKMERLEKEAILRLLIHTANRYKFNFFHDIGSLDSFMVSTERNRQRNMSLDSKLVLYTKQLLESGVFMSLHTLLIKSCNFMTPLNFIGCYQHFLGMSLTMRKKLVLIPLNCRSHQILLSILAKVLK